MQVIPIATKRLESGDDLVAVLKPEVKATDVVVVSAKVAAMTEGNLIDLSEIEVSEEATNLATKADLSPEFTQVVLDQCQTLDGRVLGSCPQAILTELKPTEGSFLTVNAGLDESNCEEGFAIGWPADPVATTENLKEKLGCQAVILSDSCCSPRRLGVTAYALTVCGMDPHLDMRGQTDLFDRTLQVTQEAVADQLATAANAVMGNGAESIPAAIIRDFKITPSEFCDWVPGIKAEEDLFAEVL